MRERYGLDPHVLTGDEEAQLTFLGATSERDPDDRTPTLVVDIGGGSTELVIGAGHEAEFHVSTQAGVVRQTERHLHHDPPPPERARRARRRRCGRSSATACPRSGERRRAAASRSPGPRPHWRRSRSGSSPTTPTRSTATCSRTDEARAIRDRLAAIPLEQRREVPGLHPDRAPTIVAGVAILLEVIDLFGLDQVEVSEHDILRGAALGLARRGARDLTRGRAAQAPADVRALRADALRDHADAHQQAEHLAARRSSRRSTRARRPAGTGSTRRRRRCARPRTRARAPSST